METVVGVKVLGPYVLEVTFDDGTVRQVDLEPILSTEAFEPLRDPDLFAQAAVDPAGGRVYWPTGADLAPEFLYYGEDTWYGRVGLAVPDAVATRQDR